MVVLAVGREVDPAEADLGAPDATLESQLAQWILDLDVQQVLEFVGGVAGFGVGDQNGTGVDQGAVAGEADLVVGPQSELVEASDLVGKPSVYPLGGGFRGAQSRRRKSRLSG